MRYYVPFEIVTKLEVIGRNFSVCEIDPSLCGLLCVYDSLEKLRKDYGEQAKYITLERNDGVDCEAGGHQ